MHLSEKKAELDGKSEVKNDEGKQLSNVTSEQLPTCGSHDMEAVENTAINFY